MSETYVPPFAQPLAGFRSRKAAQVAAFFAVKNNGPIDKLKLIKLIYLAERQFVGNNHHPMLYDELYSLPHGPICSSTLNCIDGYLYEEMWAHFVAKNGNRVVATKRFSNDDLDELSRAEIQCLLSTWDNYGYMTSSQLRNYTHEYCSEYTEIEKGRVPISYKAILEAFGDDDAERVENRISDFRRLESMLAK